MDFFEKKIFLYRETNSLVIKDLPPQTNYYKFVQENSEKNYNQFIITSDIMLDLLKFYYLKKEAKIVELDLMEDDSSFDLEFKNHIKQMTKDRAYFAHFLEEVRWLYSHESIDLKKIRVKYRINEKPVDITIYINGIISINNNESIEDELKQLLLKIEQDSMDVI